MGAGTSTAGSSVAGKAEMLKTLQAQTGFTQEQIDSLAAHFERAAALRDDDGVVSKAEFSEMLCGAGASDSVLIDRLFAQFDGDGSGGVDFREFLCGLAVLCDRTTRGDKLGFCFRMYDIDGDGYISVSELTSIVQSCLLQNAIRLPPATLDALVAATFRQADLDGDGRISRGEFEQYVVHHPQIIEQLTIRHDGLAAYKSA